MRNISREPPNNVNCHRGHVNMYKKRSETNWLIHLLYNHMKKFIAFDCAEVTSSTARLKQCEAHPTKLTPKTFATELFFEQLSFINTTILSVLFRKILSTNSIEDTSVSADWVYLFCNGARADRTEVKPSSVWEGIVSYIGRKCLFEILHPCINMAKCSGKEWILSVLHEY